MTRIAAVVLVLLSFAGTAQGKPDAKKALAGIDALIERALADQKIPGAAVAVVVGDEVVLLKGYGFRDVEKNLPMTPDTIVPIASVTKQFTVAALGTLVRKGKLEWDEPVRDSLPEFRLNDDYATLHATPRDLVTHRIGLPRHDASWFGSTSSREELVRRLRYLPFNKEIRAEFQYNNFMFMTAGYLAGRVAGKSYEDHVESSIFKPLGMSRTSFSIAELAKDADHATGYELNGDRELVREEFTSAETMAPAGAINSTARDLSHWLRMLVNGGELEGKRVLQATDVAAMMQPHMPVGPSMFPEFGFRSYGMGFYVQNYRGHDVASHGGNMPGAAAMIAVVPRAKIGVVVLTNRSYARLRDGLPFEIIDRLVGLPSAKLVSRYGDLEKKSFAGMEAAKAAGVTDRRPGTKPSHDLVEYAGRYTQPGYGAIEIDHVNGTLALTYNGVTAPLEHWHYDVFQTLADRTSELDRVRIQFQTDLTGEISAVSIPIEPMVGPMTFLKQPPAEMMERSFLERLVGTYEVAGFEPEIVLREDGVLQYVVHGSAHRLVAVRGMLFRVPDFEGMSVEFLTDASGKVDRLAILGGEGNVVGPKKK